MGNSCTSVFPNTRAWEQQERNKTSSSSRICLIALRLKLFNAFTERKKKVPFSMAIGNGELMHECFPKHLSMGTARMIKIKKQTKEVRREAWVWKKAKRARNKKRCPDGLSHPNQKTIIINKNVVIFYKKWKKYNEIQLTKSKMDLNIRKMTNHPPSPPW